MTAAKTKRARTVTVRAKATLGNHLAFVMLSLRRIQRHDHHHALSSRATGPDTGSGELAR